MNKSHTTQESSRSLLLLKLGSRLWSEVLLWPVDERPKQLTQDTFFEYVIPYVNALGWLQHLSSSEGDDARRDVSDRAFSKEGNHDPESAELFAVQTALAPRVKELISALDLEKLSAKELISPSEKDGMWSLDEKAAAFLESQGLKEGARWVRKQGKERWKNFKGAIELETERSHVLACRSLWWLWENEELQREELPPLVLVHSLARGLVKLHQKNFDLIGWNQAARIVNLQQSRQLKELSLGYCAREFVLCGLPYKPTKEKEFIRQNGDLRLKVYGDPELGIPYGQDRLIPIWLASAFQASGKPAHNRIYFRSASDILRAFEIPIDGHEMQLLKERLQRVFKATYAVEYKQKQKDGSTVWVAKRYQLITAVKLWFDKKEGENQHTLDVLWPNFIELDPYFAQDLRERSLPIDLNTIRALKRSPAVLDFYAWQAWRSFRLIKNKEKEVRVPVFGAGGLWAQFGSQAKEERNIKQLIRRWQKSLKTYWPDCPNELTSNAEWLIVRPAEAIPQNTKLSLPGVVRRPPQFAKREPLMLDDAGTFPDNVKEPADVEWIRPPGKDPFPEED
jgi:hypothetical protein